MGTPDRPQGRHAPASSSGTVSHPRFGTRHSLPGVPPLLTISSRSSFLMVTFASSFSLRQETDKRPVTNSLRWPLPRCSLGRAGKSDPSQQRGTCPGRGPGKGRHVTPGRRCPGRVPRGDKVQGRHCPGASADGYLSCLAFCSRDLRSPITDIACRNERGHPAARHRAPAPGRACRRSCQRPARPRCRQRPASHPGPVPSRRRTVSRLELWISFSSA